jgi:hypothetical protein
MKKIWRRTQWQLLGWADALLLWLIFRGSTHRRSTYHSGVPLGGERPTLAARESSMVEGGNSASATVQAAQYFSGEPMVRRFSRPQRSQYLISNTSMICAVLLLAAAACLWLSKC